MESEILMFVVYSQVGCLQSSVRQIGFSSWDLGLFLASTCEKSAYSKTVFPL